MWKTQPLGGLAGLGISPSSRMRARFAVHAGHGRQQRLRVRVVRPAEHRLRIADLHDPPEVHHRDPVGEVAHDAQVVGDQQVAGLALGLQLGQDVQDRGLDRNVERARGLVGDDDARIAGERARDRHALLEPTRQLARLEVEVALGETQVVGQLVDALVRGLALEPGQLAHRAAQDLAHGPAAVERRIGVLEDDLDRPLVLDRPAGGGRVELVVVELDRAPGVGALDAEDGLGQRRLARPGLADEAQRLAVVEREVDLDERRDAVAALVERLGHVRERETSAPSVATWPTPGRAPGCRRCGRSGGSASSGRRRRRRPAARRSGRGRRRAGSGRRRRRSAGPSRSAAACPGSWRAGAGTCAPRGAAASAGGPTVYGCCGRSNTSTALPSSTILPAYITPTRSHSERITPRLWAMSRTAAFVSLRSVRTRSSTLASTVASRPVVGSSSTSSCGIGGQRHRDHDALLHPARELMRIAIEDAHRVGDLDAVEGGQRVLLRLVLALAEDRERLDHLGPDLACWGSGPRPDPGRPSKRASPGTGGPRRCPSW